MQKPVNSIPNALLLNEHSDFLKLSSRYLKPYIFSSIPQDKPSEDDPLKHYSLTNPRNLHFD